MSLTFCDKCGEPWSNHSSGCDADKPTSEGSLAASQGSTPWKNLEAEIDVRFEEWWGDWHDCFVSKLTAKYIFMAAFLTGHSSADGKAQNARTEPRTEVVEQKRWWVVELIATDGVRWAIGQEQSLEGAKILARQFHLPSEVAVEVVEVEVVKRRTVVESLCAGTPNEKAHGAPTPGVASAENNTSDSMQRLC